MDQTYIKAASLLPPSKNILLPRPQGDGMDSETLKKQDSVPSRTVQTIGRHHNLASSPKTATYAKIQKPQFIPHEPVKGAVKPLINQISSNDLKGQLSNGPHLSSNQRVKTSPSHPKTLETSQPSTRERSDYSTKGNVLSFPSSNMSPKGEQTTRTIKVPIYNAPGHLSHNSYLMMQKQQKSSSLGKFASRGDSLAYPPQEDMKIDMEGPANRVTPENVTISMDAVLEEMRQVEGDNRTASMADLEKLNDEIDELRRELENQTRVNADLKKMLVASMGDDLHYKVDRLVQDKAQLTEEVGHYSKKIHQDYEDIDKLSIQADLWRSKFKASKVMSEELMKDNNNLRQHFQSSHLALQRLLQERQQMKEWVSQAHRHLYKVKHAFDPRYAPKQTKSGPQTLLSLTQSNLQLADNVKFRLLGPNDTMEDGVDSSTVDALSPAEAYAFLVLSTPVPRSHLTAGASKPVSPVAETIPYSVDGAHSRFHPDTKYDNLTIDVCPKCKGEIKVI